MYASITKAFTFEAAHSLPWVAQEHKCRRLHGHNYRVEITLSGQVPFATGFVVDFFEIEKRVQPLVDQLDHRCLNHIEGLMNPTAENIAAWFIKRLSDLETLTKIRVYMRMPTAGLRWTSKTSQTCLPMPTNLTSPSDD